MKRSLRWLGIALMVCSCTSSNTKTPETPVADTSGLIHRGRFPAQAGQTSTQQITALWQEALNDQQLAQNLLRDKAYVVTQEQNFQASGSASGSISGSLNIDNPLNLKGLVIGGMLGALAAFLAPAVAPIAALSSPLFFMGAAGTGAAVGSLVPSQLGSGSVQGSFSAQYSAKGWDNLQSASDYIMVVVDPDLEQAIQSQVGSNGADCTKKVDQAIQAVIQGGRYFKPAEALQFAQAVDQMRQDLTKMQSLIIDPSLSSDYAQRVNTFVKQATPFMNYQLSVVSLARHGVELQKETGLQWVMPNVSIFLADNADATCPQANWKGDLYAYTANTPSTGKDWQSILSQWHKDARTHVPAKSWQCYQYQFPVAGQSIPQNLFQDLQAWDAGHNLVNGNYPAGIYYGGDDADRLNPTPTPMTVYALASNGQTCESSAKADVTQFLDNTTQTISTYFSMIDVGQFAAMMQKTTVANPSPISIQSDKFLQ